jgi:hypothetical protein
MNYDNRGTTAKEGIITFILVVLFGLTLGLLAPDGSDAATKRVCFPVNIWNADPAKRPCQTLSVYEDGSAHLDVGTARRAIVTCTIPALHDLRRGRAITIRCKVAR